MTVDKQTLIKLREQTGAGMVDCKKALEEANGDTQKALEILRKKGAVKASKKLAEREACEGLVGSYIHVNGKVGVLVEVACETDFVAKNSDFKELVHDIAMQIAAESPEYLVPEEVPKKVIAKEKEIYAEQLKREGKPENVIDKIMAGKIEKFYTEICLLKQPFIKDDKTTIEELVQAKIAKLGEKIEVRRFVRFQI
ncbi:translation elongation factor Ts [Patescibacteria group bacterium]|nr:translation elongation factor Ts [Patescibacteria group bacterium]